MCKKRGCVSTLHGRKPCLAVNSSDSNRERLHRNVQMIQAPLESEAFTFNSLHKINVISKLITEILKINLESSAESRDNRIFSTCFFGKGSLLQTFNTAHKGNFTIADTLLQHITQGLKVFPCCAAFIFLHMGLGCGVTRGPQFGPWSYLYFKTQLLKLKVSDSDLIK